MDNDLEFQRHLEALYLQTSRNYMRQIVEAADTGNAAELEFAAHTLKGSMRVIQFSEGMEIATQLESAARTNDQAAWSELCSRLQNAYLESEEMIASRQHSRCEPHS